MRGKLVKYEKCFFFKRNPHISREKDMLQNSCFQIMITCLFVARNSLFMASTIYYFYKCSQRRCIKRNVKFQLGRKYDTGHSFSAEMLNFD